MTDQIVLYPETDYVGVIKSHGSWRIYYSVLEMWILDYKKYRPTYNPQTATAWRANLLVVDSTLAEEFCQAMHELSRDDFQRTWCEVQGKDNTLIHSKPRLVFVVDFEDKLFVNGWWELLIPFHKLIPDGWKGIEGDPHEHIPPELKALWFTE